MNNLLTYKDIFFGKSVSNVFISTATENLKNSNWTCKMPLEHVELKTARFIWQDKKPLLFINYGKAKRYKAQAWDPPAELSIFFYFNAFDSTF